MAKGDIMENPLVPVLIYPLYLLLQRLLYIITYLNWSLTGTRSKLADNRKPGRKCAQVLSVKLRCKYDLIIQSNKLEDFVLFHDRFEHPDYVLKDEVSLYHINKKDAVFVECAPGTSPWDLQKFSFSREAQFKQAVSVIIMPIVAANELAKKIGLSQEKLIVLGNTSRCGSTLLCRMFQSTGRYVSYVEPGVLCDLSLLNDLQDESDLSQYTSTTLTLLCKPRSQNPHVEGHVIKVSPSNTNLIRTVHKLYPSAHYLFSYRNQIQVMKSLARIVPSLPHTRLVGLIGLFSDSYAEIFTRYHHRGDDLLDFDQTYQSPYKRIFPICLRPTISYFTFLQDGINIHAVRFEDLIQDPEGSLKRIFSACAVPHAYIPRALIQLDRDAQEHSALSGARLHNLSIPEFTKNDQDQVKKICEQHGLPNILSDRVYPGTITFSGDLTTKYLRT